MLPEKPCILGGPQGPGRVLVSGDRSVDLPKEVPTGRHVLRQLPAHIGRGCVCVCDSVPVPAVCVRQRVPRLVYTSTVNVAFGGKPIEQGDEDSVPYFPLEKVPGFQERWAGSVGRKGWSQPQFTAQGVSQEEGVPSTGWHRPALILASHASRDCAIRWTWP